MTEERSPDLQVMNGAQAAADGDIGDGARACVALGIETDNDVLVPAGTPVVVYDGVVQERREPLARGLAVAPPLAGTAAEPPASLRPALYVEFFSAHDPGHAFLFGGDACLSLNPTWLRTLPATVGRCLAARPASFPPAARVGDLCVLRKWFAPGRALRYLPHRRPRPVAHLPEACWDRQEVYSLQEQPETLLLDMLFDYNYDRPSVFIIAPLCVVGGVPPFQRTPGSSVAHAASAWLAALPTLRILPTVADSGWRSPVDWWIVHQPPLWDEEALGVGGAAYVENWILPAEAAVEEAVEAKEDDHQPPSGASDSDSDGSVGRRWRREHEASCAARVREVAAVMQAEEGAGGALVGLHGLEGGDPIVVEDE